jgi:UDP-2,3-diacylglucosamine pyrophosphatase LpxH
MGGGPTLKDGSVNYLEDFFYDDKLVEFLQFYSRDSYQTADVELILNGDFFNHLHLYPDEPDPDIITERVSIQRMRWIMGGHESLFQAMRAFAQTSQHRITFMLGNHDCGLIWPGVQKVLQDYLGEGTTIYLEPYIFDGVYIEHGHNYFADSIFTPKRYFLTKNLPEPILNLPWGCYVVINYSSKVRKTKPYFSKVYPMRHYIRWALIHETWFAIKALIGIATYFIKLRFFRSPTRHSSIWTTMQILKEISLEQNLDIIARRILLTRPDIRLVIFGHTHEYRYHQVRPGKIYMNTGLWNEKLNLDPQELGKSIQLTYGYIEYDDAGTPHGYLKEWKGSHKVTEDLPLY